MEEIECLRYYSITMGIILDGCLSIETCFVTVLVYAVFRTTAAYASSIVMNGCCILFIIAFGSFRRGHFKSNLRSSGDLEFDADADSFYEACDPARENLCLFGKNRQISFFNVDLSDVYKYL